MAPFFENSRIGPASFTDGMSNTAAVTETVRSTSSSTYATDPLGVFLVTGNNSTTGPPLSSDADYASLCLSLPATTTQFQATRGVRWHYGAPGHSLYNHLRHAQQQAARLPGRPAAQHPVRPAVELALAEHRGAEQAPRRRELADGRRARPVHQEHDQRPGLAGPGQPQRRRGHQQRRLLISDARTLALAPACGRTNPRRIMARPVAIVGTGGGPLPRRDRGRRCCSSWRM